MDVKVDRTGVIGAGLQRTELARPEHTFEQGNDLRRLSFRCLSAIGPIIPGREIHECIGGEESDIGILREAGLHGFHGIGIGLIQSLAIGIGIRRMPLRESLDKGGLHVAGLGRILAFSSTNKARAFASASIG